MSAESITKDDIRWMAQAIKLAENGRYTTRPNPCVGCVLVKAGQLLAEGWHYRAGEAHAEVHALSQVTVEQTKGATAYVTLEPCSHQGRTGPCCDALAAAGIVRVVYGMQDPNPVVSGRGLAKLIAVNVSVAGPVLEPECEALNAGFISAMRRKRPYVRCKLAISLDGRTAMKSGESQWITGTAARADVQKLRAASGAIVTGIDSVLQDNSRLNLRREQLHIANIDDVLAAPPLRVVLDSNLRIPLDAAVLNTDAPTLVITTLSDQQLKRSSNFIQLCRQPHVQIHSVHADNKGRVDLHELLELLLTQYHCCDVLLEAGASLVGSFFEQQLIDEWVIYQAPVLLGAQARPMSQWSIHTMADKQSMIIKDRRLVGQDLRITAVNAAAELTQ